MKPSYGLADDDIAKMLEDSFKTAEVDMRARALREAQVEAERMIEATQAALAADGELLAAAERAEIDARVAALRTIAQGDDGASVFLSVPMLGSQPVPAAGAANQGTATIGAVTITDPSAATNTHTFTITFGGTSAAPTYTVTDETVAPPTTTAL